MHAVSPLGRIRESLGFRVEEVAAHCQWPTSYLRKLEASEDIDDEDAATLRDVYGVDVVRALEGHRSEMAPASLRGLLKAQADVLDADSRFAISEAAGVAVEAAELHKLLGEPVGWQSVSRFNHHPDYSHPRDGVPEKLAATVRRRLRLAGGPIQSLQEDVIAPLKILVLVTELASHIDAVSFASPATGGVIALNSRGVHTRTAFGRRVTLAHELCHILFDRPRMSELRGFCSIAKRNTDAATARRLQGMEEIERRARAFAVYLLAERAEFAEAWKKMEELPLPLRIRVLMERFGIGYEALRSHLDNVNLLSLGAEVSLVPTDSPSAWEERDPLPVNDSDGVRTIPAVRRGQFLDTVGRCWARGALSESGARGALRISLSEWPAVHGLLAQRYGLGGNARGWSTSSAATGLD